MRNTIIIILVLLFALMCGMCGYKEGKQLNSIKIRAEK